MIFADKLMHLRRRSGWSQEELADQLGVTRQTISKWEGAQSVPDLEKMVRLAQIFSVSTDYLLRDDITETGDTPASDTPDRLLVSMETANAYLASRESAARSIALGVFLCVLSPVCLLVLSALCESSAFLLTENAAGAIGMIVLLVCVAAAVAIFILCAGRGAAFSRLREEPFDAEYGVCSMAAQRKEQYAPIHTRGNVLGSVLCIGALIPLFTGILFAGESATVLTLMIALGFVLAGAGAACFVRVGVVWASFETLLQEGDYTRQEKRFSPLASAISTVYWVVVTALFLGYSFLTHDWGRSWVVWPIAGVFYPALLALVRIFRRDRP